MRVFMYRFLYLGGYPLKAEDRTTAIRRCLRDGVKFNWAAGLYKRKFEIVAIREDMHQREQVFHSIE